MKVAIVRGPSLNPWEMQSYAPLVSKVDLVAVGSTRGQYDLSQTKIPLKRLTCPGEYAGVIPRGISFLYAVLGDPQMLIGFDRFVEGFDIVHTAETGSYYSLQAVRAKEKGLVKRVVISVWETIPFLGEKNVLRREHQQEVRKKADWFLAVTERAKQGLIAEGVRSQKITVIPMGVDVTRFTPRKSQIANRKSQLLRKTRGFRENDFVVLFVGRLVREKGVYELVEAARRIAKSRDYRAEGRAIRFVFVGEGPEWMGLRKEVKRLGLEELVSLRPGEPFERMPEILRSSDVLVLPSLPTSGWEEQFGMVLVEAMASGVPIIASRTGAIPEVVGRAGMIVEPGDSGALSDAILRVFKDRQLRQELVRKGRERARLRYDGRKIASRIASMYEDILRLS